MRYGHVSNTVLSVALLFLVGCGEDSYERKESENTSGQTGGQVETVQHQESAQLDEKFSRADRLADRCRGGSGDDDETLSACNQSYFAALELAKLGWCWGGADAEFKKKWVECSSIDGFDFEDMSKQGPPFPELELR